MKRIALVLIVMVTGCAAPRPLVDPARTDMQAYERDLQECRSLSGEVAGPGTTAAVGAGIGYALGQVLCRTMGGRNCSAFARGAAVAGGASGAASGVRSESEVVRNCLRGRGHNPL